MADKYTADELNKLGQKSRRSARTIRTALDAKRNVLTRSLVSSVFSTRQKATQRMPVKSLVKRKSSSLSGRRRKRDSAKKM